MFAGKCSLSLPFLFLSPVLVFCSLSAGSLDSLAEASLRICELRLERSVAEVRDSSLYPTYGTPDLKWKLKGAEEWTSGFFPGCLWYGYEATADPKFERWASEWTAGVEREDVDPNTHDLGFKFICSFGNGLRLGKGEAYGRYRTIMLTAAQTLAGRFNPTVGCLSSNWDRVSYKNSFPVLIDIMMNLELLFWASENGGPPEFARIAETHATTTCRDFIRGDGGTYHVVRYDSTTGKIIKRGTLQGSGDETTWSRGQAWGIYGMVVAYRYTKEQKFLAAAEKLADYFLDHLAEDHISNWDFQSTQKHPDASATCTAASALFELTKCAESDSLRKRYRTGAETMLAALCAPPYLDASLATNCLLTHSVQYFPLNSNVDVPSIFADYYFLEALLRYRALRASEKR